MGIFDGVLAAVAGPLVKDLFGDDESASYSQQQDFAREQATANANLQKEFAQYGVRWRVEDAKAAGLHPMYALSGGGAAFAPNPIVMPGTSPARSGGFGDSLAAGLTQFFKNLEKKDEVIAQAVNAVAAVAGSNSISSVPAPSDYRWDFEASGGPMHAAVNLQNAFDVQQFQAAPVLSSSMREPSLTPGVGPGGAVHNIAPGFQMILPSSSSGGTSEALEALSESWELAYAYIHRNVQAYGQDWLDQAKEYFPVTSRLYQVVQNVRNAGSWAVEVPAALTGMGHRAQDWVRQYNDSPGRGPTVRGRIRR